MHEKPRTQNLSTTLSHMVEEIGFVRAANPELYRGLEPALDRIERDINELIRYLQPRRLSDIIETEHLTAETSTAEDRADPC